MKLTKDLWGALIENIKCILIILLYFAIGFSIIHILMSYAFSNYCYSDIESASLILIFGIFFPCMIYYYSLNNYSLKLRTSMYLYKLMIKVHLYCYLFLLLFVRIIILRE